jgi:hypothetical protein
VKQDAAIERRYREMMDRIWSRIASLKRHGVPDEHAHYLLPNAVAVRFTESTDFLNLRHKHVMRLCYLAQEEIWQASVDEAMQVAEVHPRPRRAPPAAVLGAQAGGDEALLPRGGALLRRAGLEPRPVGLFARHLTFRSSTRPPSFARPRSPSPVSSWGCTSPAGACRPAP